MRNLIITNKNGTIGVEKEGIFNNAFFHRPFIIPQNIKQTVIYPKSTSVVETQGHGGQTRLLSISRSKTNPSQEVEYFHQPSFPVDLQKKKIKSEQHDQKR